MDNEFYMNYAEGQGAPTVKYNNKDMAEKEAIPLDVHVGNTARQLGLLTRKSNDRKAVEELTRVLREFQPEDPTLYDFALFGVGANGENIQNNG